MSDPLRPIIGPEGMASPPNVGAQISSVEKKADAAIESLRREMTQEATFIKEMIKARWVAHDQVHAQEQEALRISVGVLDKRADNANEWRGAMDDRETTLARKETLAVLEARMTRVEQDFSARLDRFEQDTRARFEGMERLLRAEARPGQDLKTSWGAIIGAIGLLATILAILGYVLR